MIQLFILPSKEEKKSIDIYMPSSGNNLKSSWSSRDLRESTLQPSSDFRSFQLDVGSLSLLPEFNDLPTTAGSTMEDMLMEEMLPTSGTVDQRAGSINGHTVPHKFPAHPWWNAPEKLHLPNDSMPTGRISGHPTTTPQPPLQPPNNHKDKDFDDTVMGAVRRFEAMRRRSSQRNKEAGRGAFWTSQ